MNYTPPFVVSAKSISMIAEIAALTERMAIRMEQKDGLRLRRINRIKTIHSSLAIEGNTLSESQVTEIINGKPVVAPLREIQEVKNSIATYDLFEKLDPFSMKDLLRAHGTMMLALVDEAGQYRSGGVGVFAGKTLIHAAPPAKLVPEQVENLFTWLKQAKDHLLIRSCVFHYEFEFIHPFADGNGRMGRLWQSLLLSHFHPVFQYLPVETMVHNNQQAYYTAIANSTSATNSGIFIDFMLGEILKILQKHKESPSGKTDQVADQVADQVMRVIQVLAAGEKSSTEIRIALGLKHNPTFRANHLLPSIAAGLVEMTQPDSPRSPVQKYCLTTKGRSFLSLHK